MFLWFGIKKTIAFCSLLKLFVQTKGNCHGEESTIFPGFAPVGAPPHSRLPDCLATVQGQVSRTERQGLLCWNVSTTSASLRPPDLGQLWS